MGAYGSPELHPALRDSEYDRLQQLKWKYCEKCGHKFLETEKACPKCGYKPKPKRSGWTVFWAAWALAQAVFWGCLMCKAAIDNIGPEIPPPPVRSEIQTQSPAAVDPHESMFVYKSSCQKIDYATLARNPDKYKGQRFTIDGEVIQVTEISGGVLIRMNMTYTEYEYLEGGSWDDTIVVVIPLAKTEDRILEDDIITIWGECEGLYTYETVLGSSLSVPRIRAKYHDLHE